VLVHRATTANADRRHDIALRITQTSRERNRKKRLEQVVLERARTSVGRRDLSLATTERFGRLIRWIGYAEMEGFQAAGQQIFLPWKRGRPVARKK